MDFPAWFVDYLTAPMLIPTIAIPHVIVAQFAVGGGIVLADMVRRSYQEQRNDVLDFLHTVTRYFILITVVFGAVTGVGIWWTIGLTSPDATSVLINLFSFVWATEWVMFLVEIVAAFAFYYLWDVLSPREHVTLGWIYGITAWFSLVLITGITSFMLTSGSWEAGDGTWTAFFNPSFLPQTLLRTGGSLAIAALGIGFFVSFYETSDRKDHVIVWISNWAVFGMVLIMAGGLWQVLVLPDHVLLNLIRAPILIVMITLNFLLTVVVLGALGSGIVSGSKWITPPAAGLLLLAGMAAIASGEFIREGSRKPYLIRDYMYSPGVRVADVPKFREEGFTEHTPWLKRYLEQSNLTLASDTDEGNLDRDELIRAGRGIFRYHCASCHASVGYNGIKPILEPWSREMIMDTTKNLHRANPAMPPWFGNKREREALGEYLIFLKKNSTFGEVTHDPDR